MNLQINCTCDGVKTYPIHKHTHYEIMLYLSGNGFLRTTDNNYPFSPGSIIIVPPGTEHGSTSENGFKNISIGGNFGHLLHFKAPASLTDNERQEGRILAELIFNNRYGNKEFLSDLCTTYIRFMLQNMQREDNVSIAVNKIISRITESAYDYNVSLNSLLLNSGYAEDYIRVHFKRITGKTPVEFLTKIRIDHACFLINIYGSTLTLSQIAEQCGYVDYVYFSKRFKSVTGMSPGEYRKRFG